MKMKMPKQGIAFGNNYPAAILALFFLLISFNSVSQIHQPSTLWGKEESRTITTKAMQGPTGNGAPTSSNKTSRKNFAIYLDSTNFRLYVYNPSTSLWDTAHIGASSGGSTNTSIGSAYKIAVNGTNNIKSLANTWGLVLDSATSGQVGLRADTSSGKLATKTDLLSYANTALSNLASVAINTSLLPGTSASINLGSITKNWKNIYMSGTTSSTDGIIYRNGSPFIHNYQASGSDGDNTFIGSESGGYFALSGTGSSGSYNLAVGPATLRANTTGSRNTAIGTYAQQGGTTGVNNTSVGQNTLFSNTTGYNNTVMGVRAAAFGTGHDEVGVGVDALSRGSSGSFNVGVGTDALYNVWNSMYSVAVGDSTFWVDSTGFKNTAVGSRAGYYLGDTYPNFATRHDSLVTFIGADASRDSSISGNVALNNLTVIGYNAKGLASNQVVLGNNDVTTTLLKGNIGIGTFTPAEKLEVVGNSKFTGTIYGNSNAYNNQTGTTYSLQSSDNGKILTISNASAITLTVPAGLPAGFNCTIVQKGAGQITFTASSTTINNRQSFTKTAGQYAAATILMYASDTFLTQGDMQ